MVALQDDRTRDCNTVIYILVGYVCIHIQLICFTWGHSYLVETYMNEAIEMHNMINKNISYF